MCYGLVLGWVTICMWVNYLGLMKMSIRLVLVIAREEMTSSA